MKFKSTTTMTVQKSTDPKRNAEKIVKMSAANAEQIQEVWNELIFVFRSVLFRNN